MDYCICFCTLWCAFIPPADCYSSHSPCVFVCLCVCYTISVVCFFIISAQLNLSIRLIQLNVNFVWTTFGFASLCHYSVLPLPYLTRSMCYALLLFTISPCPCKIHMRVVCGNLTAMFSAGEKVFDFLNGHTINSKIQRIWLRWREVEHYEYELLFRCIVFTTLL